MRVDEAFVVRMRGMWGADADAWLADLPARVAELASRWDIREPGDPLAATFNIVLPARLADGTPVVLKLGMDRAGLASEAAALAAFDGQGAVRLLASDEVAGALLLERALPGTSLWDERDDLRTLAIATKVMRQLHHVHDGASPFPTIADWGRAFARYRAQNPGEGPLDAGLLVRAESTFAELVASSGPAVLLHGDLHHGNIVDGGTRGWLAVDPKGVLGEAAYEAGAFIRNPMPELLAWPDLAGTLARRVAHFADALGEDRARIAGWAFAQAALAAVWSLEDGTDPGPWMALAAVLADVL